MDNEIKVEGFHVIDPGDISVGNYPARWELTGTMFFDSKEDFEDFRAGLKQLFAELVTENPGVLTFEEMQEINMAQ